MIIYSSAVIAKIRRDMLKASEKTKARICRKLYHKIAEKDFITLPEGTDKVFIDMYKSADFDQAIEYLHDIVLPAMKKQNSIRYEGCLHTIQSAMTHHEIPTYNEELIDETWKNPMIVQPLLKRYEKEMKIYIFQSHMADLIYWLESVLKHTAPEQLVGLKLCLFHLMTQAITNRKNHTFAQLYYEDTFLFFQEKYNCFDEKDSRQLALLNFKVHKNDFKADWNIFFSKDAQL